MNRLAPVVFSAVAAPFAVLAAQPRLESQISGTTARLQAVSAVSKQVAWASGTRGTYVVTTDGGSTWRVGVVPGADSLEFRDVHAFDARQAVLLAAGPGDKSRIYRTTDGGATWKLLFTNAVKAAFYDCLDFRGRVGVVVSDAVDGRFPLLRSTDSGASWAPWNPKGVEAIRAVPGEGAFAASGTCLSIGPDGNVWVATATGGRVLRFGETGSAAMETPSIKGESSGPASIAFRSTAVGIAAGGNLSLPNDFTDNVIATVDGGKTWSLTGRPTFAGAVFGVQYIPGRGPTAVAVGPKGSAVTTDDGKTWKRLDDQDYWGIGFAPDGTGWLTGPNGKITKVTPLPLPPGA